MPAPELADEWVGVRERYFSACSLADVADGEAGLDGVVGEEACERTVRSSGWLEEHPRSPTVVKGETPPVRVFGGLAAALPETAEREDDIRWDVALHPEKLAHALDRGG